MAKTYKASLLSVYDKNGNKIPIPAIKVNLTEADKQEIAEIVLNTFPAAEEVAL